MVTGISFKTDSNAGLEAQSMAFFNTTGTLWLYSGVQNTIPSADGYFS
jgi:hypothetical protein